MVDAALSLPKDVLLEDRFRGMSAERICNLLAEEENGGAQETETERILDQLRRMTPKTRMEHPTSLSHREV